MSEKFASHVNHKKKKLLVTALSAATAAIFAGSSHPGYAQEGAGDVEEVRVTGTRIRQSSGFTTPTPVTAVTTAEMFQFEPGNNISRQLNALPQFFGNVSTQNASTALVSTTGTSSLNLRSLGGNRTLVLLDGIRVVPSAKDGVVNVDAFPTALMRSVDVVTGGASAAYGADAVSGVVNFVLDREFQGFKAEMGGGQNEFGDGQMWNISLAGGVELMDGRLNLIGSVEAREIDQIQRLASEVPEMRRLGFVTNPAWRASDPRGTNPQRLTLPWVTSIGAHPYGLITAPGTPLHNMHFTADGQNISPFIYGDVSSLGGPGSTRSTSGSPEAFIVNDANSGGINGEQAKNQSAFFAAQYRFTENFSVFGQFLLGRTDARSRANRGSTLLSTQWAPQIAVDNAFLPENVRQIMIARNMQTITVHKSGTFAGLNDYGYGTTNSKVFTTTSYAGGFDWDLDFKDWHLRGLVQEGTSERISYYGNLWRVDRAFLSMDAVRDPSTGAIVCRINLPQYRPTPEQLAASPSIVGLISSRSAPGATKPGDPGALPVYSPIGLDNTVRDCVPHNVLGAGNISDDALRYIHADPKFGWGEVDQTFAELLLTGELYEGWGAGPVGFAAGLTWRDQEFFDDAGPYGITTLVADPRNDPNLGIRGIPINYVNATNMHQNSTLPMISGDASVWESFAELSIPLWTGNIAGQEQNLTTDLAFRRSDYDRSGAADSWKLGLNFQVIDDVRLRATKSRDAREPTFSELFDAQGTNGQVMDPLYNGQSFEISVTRGGNPNLAPEEANTLTAGVVWSPSFSFLEGLQMSVDWYDVQVEGSVALLGHQRMLDECRGNAQSPLCEFVVFNPQNQVVRIFDTYQNVAGARVRGVDYELAYRMEPDFFAGETESLSVRALAGYVAERSNTAAGGTPQDVSGGLGTPELTGLLTVSYNLGPWSLSMQGRYRDEALINTTWTEGVEVDDNTLPSYTFWNAMFGYRGETGNGNTWRVSLNVQNLFDKPPTAVPGTASERFAAQSLTGDLYGRRYNLNVNFDF
ncbi:MAG: TonB-dependent receptor domain-containing protein [Gammaproteobacteria bacterium]